MGAQPSAPQHSNLLAGEPIGYKKREGCLDNLAHVTTNKKAVLQQLFAAVSLLTATTATLMEDIRVLTANNKYISGLEHSATTNKQGKGK